MNTAITTTEPLILTTSNKAHKKDKLQSANTENPSTNPVNAMYFAFLLLVNSTNIALNTSQIHAKTVSASGNNQLSLIRQMNADKFVTIPALQYTPNKEVQTYHNKAGSTDWNEETVGGGAAGTGYTHSHNNGGGLFMVLGGHAYHGTMVTGSCINPNAAQGAESTNEQVAADKSQISSQIMLEQQKSQTQESSISAITGVVSTEIAASNTIVDAMLALSSNAELRRQPIGS